LPDPRSAFNASSETFVGAWGAVIALESVLFAAALAVLVVGIALEQDRLKERRAAYTDFLTGIGNRRAGDCHASDYPCHG
jgi:hypothetical protein